MGWSINIDLSRGGGVLLLFAGGRRRGSKDTPLPGQLLEQADSPQTIFRFSHEIMLNHGAIDTRLPSHFTCLHKGHGRHVLEGEWIHLYSQITTIQLFCQAVLENRFYSIRDIHYIVKVIINMYRYFIMSLCYNNMNLIQIYVRDFNYHSNVRVLTQIHILQLQKQL